MSSDHMVNEISDTNYLGTYVRESHLLDRFMYFNFKFYWRILTDVNALITVYVFYYVFFKKDANLQVNKETEKKKVLKAK